MNRLNKIIEYGLYSFIFLLPLQTRWILKQGEMNGWPYEFSTISIYAIDVLLIGLIILQAVKYFGTVKERNVENAKIPIYWWFLAGLELMTFISIFVAPDKIVAIYKYCHLLLAIGAFWLIVDAKYNKQKLIYYFILSSALQALLGVWQFLAQSTFANKWIGMALHPIQESGTAVVINETGGRMLRAYGSLDHPNIFGGLMVVALWLIFFYIKGARQTNKKEKWFLLISTIILSFGLFFSFSRAAWVSLFISFIASLLFLMYKRDKIAIKKQAIFGFVILLVAGSLLLMYKDIILNRIENNVYTEQKSIIERAKANQISIEIIKSHWLLGAGIGNYGLVVKEKYMNLNYQLYQPVHNVFLLVFSEVGIIGLIAFSLFFISVILASRVESPIYFQLMICFLILFFFDHWLFSLHYGIMLLFIIFGLAVKGEKLLEL